MVLNDFSIGVPVILGKNGIESIVELELTEAEKEKLKTVLRQFETQTDCWKKLLANLLLCKN